MTERPILFSGQMVRAILEGRKTQTRRLVKPQPPSLARQKTPWCSVEDLLKDCPYGQLGDRLWVRETFFHGSGQVIYRATDNANGYIKKWKPAIFMPRWACRLVLEVTAVRVERLQEINTRDLFAEGVNADIAHVRGEYADLWDSLNAKRAPWSSNPWVWVIEFRRVP